MPLPPDQQQAIRDEEFFRAEIRRQLDTAGRDTSFAGRVGAFFETKAGFWILTTALASLGATGFATLERYLAREEIQQRQAAEQALRDTDTLIKLGPMLTSDKRSQVDIAIVLLDGLASGNAVDQRVVDQVRALMQTTVETGTKPGASTEERLRAEAVLSYADRARVAAIQSPDPPTGPEVATPSVVSSAIDSPTLPIRVYIQIGGKHDSERAEQRAAVLRAADIVVPGIEVVGARRTPAQDSVRYCADKVASEALQRVKAASATLQPVPGFVVLDPKLCGRVRFNHFELWLGQSPDPTR